MPRAVIRPLIEQHAEDAAFLWLLRDAAAHAPHYSLAELAKLDGRLEAQLDALRLDPELSWRICWKVLKLEGAGEVFIAAVLALERGQAAEIEEVLKVGAAMPPLGCGLVSALGWLPYERAAPHLEALLAAAAPERRRVGIAAAAAHRKNPGQTVLQNAFASDEPLLKARALRAAGELGLLDLQHALRANLRAKEPACRFWAAWSSALLSGQKDAVTHLQEVAEAGGPFAERAAPMVMRRLAPNDAKVWLKRLVKDLGRNRIALIAAGALADPEAIPFLIAQMKVPELARVAGESFSLITGANISYEDLDGEKPEGFEAGPTEDPEDEDVAMDPDENLPWPDPALVKKWWETRQGRFTKGTRYLLGQPITPGSLQTALKDGYQRQREAAALERAILNPGKPLFEVRAPGFRQRKLLA